MFKKIFHAFALMAFLTALLAVTPVTPAYAATLTVNTLVDENDGSCVDGDCSLRDALQVAGSGDTINFSVTGTILLSGQLNITKPVTIDGPGSALLTIDGNDTHQVLFINGGAINVNISGLTITGGYTVSNGAGIDNQWGLLSLDDMVITNNRTDSLYSKGGGINAASGSLTITNSHVTFNQSDIGSGIICAGCVLTITNTDISNNNDVDTHQDYTYGGGLIVSNASNATISGVTISGNTAGAAGGVYFSESTFNIQDSVISMNTADQESGGGIFAYNSSGTITDSAIIANTGFTDGGVSLYTAFADTVEMNNVTIYGNQATGPATTGGGIYVSALMTASLNNVTVANNSSVEAGAGIFASGTVNLGNSIVADNASTNSIADDCYGILHSLDYNLVENTGGSCTFTGTTTHNITGQDPSLPAALEQLNGTFVIPLNAASPAIDAADNATCETADQRGQARPVGPACDMGAFEFSADIAAVTNTNDSGGGSLRFAVAHMPATGGTVTFDSSLAGQTITLASPINITSDVSINGASLDPYITISGNDAHVIFGVDAGVDASISSVNLVHGLAPSGVYLGGAIYNLGSLSIYNVNFSNNVAEWFGGAIFNNLGASLYVADSTFTNNSAADADNLTPNGGGAIANDGGDIEIHTSTFSNNSTDGNGGALYLDGGVQRIYTSTFNNNTANGTLGGAIYTANSAMDVSNSTFFANSVTGGGGIGGGIYNDTTTFVRNSTFSGNSAPGGGAALASDDAIEVYNSILANSAGGVSDCLNDGGTVDKNINNLMEFSACGSPFLSSDPMLNALADNGGPTMTMTLQIGSPALNAGDAASCLVEDQRGQARPTETACEIGAVEVLDSVPPAVVSLLRVNSDPTSLASVQYTVAFTENVNGVNISDFSLLLSGISGATVTGVSGSGDTYTVTVNTGTGNGTLRLDLIDDNSITDDNGVLLGGLALGDGNSAGQSYVISKTGPVQLVPSNGANLPNLRPDFDWAYIGSGNGYQIQVSKAPNFGTTLVNAIVSGLANSQYTPTKDLPANSLLYWRVRVRLTATKYGAWSSAFTFTTGNPPSVPNLVSPANNALVTTLTPTLDWSDSTVPAGTTFDRYQVQLDDSADFSSPLLDANSNVSTLVTGPLSMNMKYYWRVRAWNTDSNYSAWSAVRTFREAIPAPTLISPILGVTVPNLKPTFDWSDVVGASGYTIQVSLSNTFNSFALNVTLNAPTSVYATTINLQPGKTYFWRVRANGANGPSLWSVVGSFVTP